ncbi:MAG TPA: hypothetical protein VJB65_01655 [Patescibacteria group bacterium]|nr:hypothetical protein [Patescibacteria group bacterium]
MIQVVKKDKQSNESLMRLFSRKVQSIGLLKKKKKDEFFKKKPKKNQLRKDAIHRNRKKTEETLLIKTGKLKVQEPQFGKGKKKK